MTLRLRPYQWDAVEQALAALRKHHRVLLTMATGLGKTVVFSEVAKRYAAYGRVLIITHRAELVWQTLRHLEEHFPGIEMRGYAHGSGYSKRRIVVGTIQTVHRRLTRFVPETFSLVIFDEAHHCPAPTWTKVMRTFDGAKVLGVTATPRRTDGTPLYGFETIAFSYPLSAAITDRWLVPVRAMRMHRVTVDLSEATVAAGDYTAESLDRILAEESKLHAIADAALDHADKKVLVFMPSNDSAQRLCDVIERYVPNCAAAITYRQRDEERRANVELFRSGQRRILVNCMIATEGFDAPDVGVIIVGRPTRSPLLYEQMIGRGTRPLSGLLCPDDDLETRTRKIAESAKPHLLVINTRTIRGKYIDVANVINPELPPMDDEVAAAVEERVGEDPTDAIELAIAAEEEQQRIIAQQRRNIVATYVDYQLSRDGVLSMFGISPSDAHAPLADTNDAISQEAKLLGVPLTNMTEAMWEQLKRELERRKAANLASYKQLRVLKNRGIPVEVLRSLKIGEASVLIEALKAGNYIYFAGIRPPKTIQQLEEMRRHDVFRRRSRGLLG